MMPGMDKMKGVEAAGMPGMDKMEGPPEGGEEKPGGGPDPVVAAVKEALVGTAMSKASPDAVRKAIEAIPELSGVSPDQVRALLDEDPGLKRQLLGILAGKQDETDAEDDEAANPMKRSFYDEYKREDDEEV